MTVPASMTLSDVAKICTAPGATPDTSPVVAFTVAIASSALVHVIVRPVRTLFAASLTTADSMIDWPTCTIDVSGLTSTDATGAGRTLNVSATTGAGAQLPSPV